MILTGPATVSLIHCTAKNGHGKNYALHPEILEGEWNQDGVEINYNCLIEQFSVRIGRFDP